MNQYRNYIAGEWVDGNISFADINPSDTDDVVGEASHATPQQIAEAVTTARSALPGWSGTTTQTRSDILSKISNELFARKDELGELIAREEGKTRAEASGEVIRAANIFRFFSSETVRIRGEKLASVRANIDVEVSREPVGVIGVITPWNFPIAIPAWKIAPALAFGNTVVFKPSELTPAISCALAEIIVRAGVPAGVFNMVQGTGPVAGEAIVDAADAITFTGSAKVGRHIVQRATSRMIRVQAEMGGKNPLVILDDAHFDTAVSCALDGSFFQTGQRCTASSRLIVTEGIHDRFVNALTERLKKIEVGHALEASTQVGPVVEQRQLNQDLRYIDVGINEGARPLLKGELLKRTTPGFYLSPTLFIDSTNQMRINREEIFGPVAAVIRVRDYDEALAVANDTPFGLSSGICTTSQKYARDFQMHSQSGLTMLNLPTAGLDYHVPFGGRKASSFGAREQGTYAIDFYTIVKTSYLTV